MMSGTLRELYTVDETTMQGRMRRRVGDKKKVYHLDAPSRGIFSRVESEVIRA